jgi:uncharacterized membrane protein
MLGQIFKRKFFTTDICAYILLIAKQLRHKNGTIHFKNNIIACVLAIYISLFKTNSKLNNALNSTL